MPPVQMLSRLFEPAADQRLTGWLFLKLLALIYFAAFFSLVFQIEGLVGPQGILPYGERLQADYSRYGPLAWLYNPTLFWFNAGDAALQGAAITGCLLSVALLFARRPLLPLILLFILYLSLMHAGQMFLNFQWDTLLLESGFLAILIARGPNLLTILLFHWLLFRLRFLSGISKLLSQDPAWSGLTALNSYFETQPLPHTGAWYAHQLPEWMLQGATGIVLFSEIIVPFFIFLPRPFRLFAAAITILIQLLIIMTSNHNWINLLTILLCIFLLDDRIVARVVPARLANRIHSTGTVHESKPHNLFCAAVAVLILTASLSWMFEMITGKGSVKPVREIALNVRSFGQGNVFHVFPTMQVERQELQIEGSQDGIEWRSYEFNFKPGALNKRPEFIVPWQPRLDWMIWFVPSQRRDQLYWLDRLLQHLERNTPQVTALLANNPFSGKPPRYLRVLAFRYHFTTAEERATSGNWWRRELLGEFPYVPPRVP
ncbi:MAG: lipase maturation factor family protein [Pseudomonadota bacterium]